MNKTFCSFNSLIRILLTLSDFSSFKVRTNPGWFEKIENAKLFCDFSCEKTENSVRFEIPKKSEDLVRPKNFPPYEKQGFFYPFSQKSELNKWGKA